mmetsp:Transcript_8308/g.14075  ORF Transcript_8308/g.14075 Transcript_8308/m.14075 type:complete len:595 (+) Transcript_8308:31-1815(+)
MIWALSIALSYLSVASVVDAHSYRYANHQRVDLLVNTVGPFNNPTETYPYYSLPFCRRTGKQRSHRQSLSETMSGSRKVHSPYELTFLDPVPWRALCEEFMDVDDLKELKSAIEDDYFFEMFLDDLPMWGYVGEVTHEEFLLGKSIQGARVYLYPHLHFSMGYNGDQIVSVNVTTDPKRRVDITDIIAGQEIVFSYSVEWVNQPDIKYDNRMQRYEDSAFLPSSFEIHWLSIINSFVLVLLLTAFLAIILMRILKNDFSRYMDVDEDELTEEETGWKMINGDVFRPPSNVSFFSACVGAGAQIFLTAFVLLCAVVMEVFKATRRGALLTACIMIYSMCGFFGGFVSGRLFKQLKGSNWVFNVIITAMIFPVPLFVVFSWVNSVAATNNSTAALPFTTIMLIASIFVFVHFPLTVVGAVTGRNMTAGEYKAPSRTNKVPREVPKVQAWYRYPLVQLFMAGFLPFSAIYIELHYIFASIWGHKIYSLFGILFIAFIMLSTVASFITIALLYFQLVREDHRWWWSTFFNGGSTGFFIMGYSFFYFFHRSQMDGLLQGSFYFGYMTLVSYAFFLMLGFVGFMSSFSFVDYIYGSVKCD